MSTFRSRERLPQPAVQPPTAPKSHRNRVAASTLSGLNSSGTPDRCGANDSQNEWETVNVGSLHSGRVLANSIQLLTRQSIWDSSGQMSAGKPHLNVASSGKRKREATELNPNFRPTFVPTSSPSHRVVAPSESPAQQDIAAIRSRVDLGTSSKKQKSTPSIQPFLNLSKRSLFSSIVSTLPKQKSSRTTRFDQIHPPRPPSPSVSSTSSRSTPMLQTESSSCPSSRHSTPASSAPSLLPNLDTYFHPNVSHTPSTEPPAPLKRSRIDSTDSPATSLPTKASGGSEKETSSVREKEEEVVSLQMKRKDLGEGKDLLRDLNRRWGELDAKWEKLS
ncbi:hypothetical protein JCM3765_001492 [Sporobolomyces pararoseus]